MVTNVPASARVTVRTVREQDVAPLAEALAPEVGASQAAHRWKEHCDGHREMLVAELDGRVVGMVSVDRRGSHRPGSLSDSIGVNEVGLRPKSERMFALDVGPAFRRRGVGSALVAAVEEEARRRGLRSVHPWARRFGFDRNLSACLLHYIKESSYTRIGGMAKLVPHLRLLGHA